MKKVKFCILSALVLFASLCHAQVVDTLNIQSAVFNASRKIKISLPEDYGNDPNEKFIVAYLFDSQSEDFFNFYRTTINYLEKQGYIKPLILVGIASENRQYEFTPKAETAPGLKYFMKSGGAELLAEHLKNEVFPAIKNKYRCNNYSIGIGHSLGATFVSYCLLKFPGLFKATIAISPNYQFDKQQLVHKFDSLPDPKILDHKFLYIAHGAGDAYEDDFKAGSNRIDSILIRRNYPGLRWQFKTMDNDSHGTTAMEGVFKGLVALYREFTLTDKQINAFYKDTQKPFVDNLKAYYAQASAWAGIQLPLPEDINNMAYNCFYTGRKTDAIALFTWGLDLYPDNINLYDGMGEMQQRNGDKTEALNYYNKGLALVNRGKDKMDAKTYKGTVEWFQKRLTDIDK